MRSISSERIIFGGLLIALAIIGISLSVIWLVLMRNMLIQNVSVVLEARMFWRMPRPQCPHNLSGGPLLRGSYRLKKIFFIIHLRENCVKQKIKSACCHWKSDSRLFRRHAMKTIWIENIAFYRGLWYTVLNFTYSILQIELNFTYSILQVEENKLFHWV